ncbi:DUF2795 domain-containing protein [Longispora urticae]
MTNPIDPHTPAAAKGITPQEVADRSEIARHLQPGQFPADADQIRAMATGNNAPDHVQGQLSRLPAGTYDSVADVWTALGHGIEEAPDGSPTS